MPAPSGETAPADGGGPAHILAVCTGNVCRSPFIELLLRSGLDERRPPSSPGIEVASAGTGALVGAAMDARAADQARARGLEPGTFRARSLTPAMVAEADLVLTATRWHRGRVVTMYPKALPYTFALLDFADLVGRLPVTEAGPTDTSPAQSRERVQALVRAVAASRGSVAPLPAENADIVDPYRREDEFFERMAQQVLGPMPAVVAGLSA